MLAPAWVIGSLFSLWWPATVVFMCFIGALVALNIFMLAHELTGKLWIAAAVWVALAFSNPLMTYSYLIFTELTCGLLLIYAFRRLALGWSTNGPCRLLLIGICIGYIPWVAWRCLFITIPLALYAAIQWWRASRTKDERRKTAGGGQLELDSNVTADNTAPSSFVFRPSSARSALSTLYVFVPILISAIGLVWYNVTLFGSFLPTTRTSELGDQPLFFFPWSGIEGMRQFAVTGFGFLFDRLFGLLVYAPIYLLAAVGMIAMFRSRRRSDRRLFFSMLLVLGPYLGLMMSFFYWNGLWCPPARFMTTFAPLLAAPLAMSLYALHRSWTYKGLFVLLAIPGWISMAIVMRDPRHMWPGNPVYEWLANSPDAPIKVNLTNILPAIDPLDDKRLPGNTAWIAAASVGIVLFCYLLMLWNERRGRAATRTTDDRRQTTGGVPLATRRWPLVAHGVVWLIAMGIISSGWYLLNSEYIKPKTLLTETGRWVFSSPVNDPGGIAYLDNKLYIAGYGANGWPSVGELDLATGAFKYLSPVTPQGVPLTFSHPGEIKLGLGNLLYVLNNGPNEQSLYIMRPDGQVQRQVTLNGKTPIAVGLDFGPDGMLYVGDMTGGSVRKYEIGGGDPLGNWGGMGGGFNNVGGVAVDKDGTIYAAEISFQRVQKLRSDGTFVQKYDIKCSPNKLAISGDWIDVTCDKGLVSINKASGEIRQSLVVGDRPQLVAPTALTYGPDGTLYVVDQGIVTSYKVQH